MSCLSPYLRIRIGNVRKGTMKFKNKDTKVLEDKFVDFEEEGILKEKARIVVDLPSNRQKLEELNIPYTVIPCGVCEDCYKKRVKEWSIRILNETKYHRENYFVTLTYDDAHLPKNRSLDKSRIQTFFKSLKKGLSRKFEGISIKYYCVGEYGEGKGERLYLNPHYHFIGFNIPLVDLGLTTIFPDNRKHYSQSGDLLMYSEFLSKLWPEGFVTVQEVTFGSAAYVAGYVHKKLKDEKPVIHKEVSFVTNPSTGRVDALVVPVRYNPYELLGVVKPFSLMSKGIGEQYFKDNEEKIYNTDEIFYNSGKFGIKSCLPPRYFDKKLAQHNQEKAKFIKDKRTALSQAKNGFISDSEYLYNKNVRNSLSSIKQTNRKRGLASLS